MLGVSHHEGDRHAVAKPRQPTAAHSVSKVTSRAWELRVHANEEDFDGFYQAVFARLVGQLALVTGDHRIGLRELLAVAEGMRQP
jgi:hypothetical protein